MSISKRRTLVVGAAAATIGFMISPAPAQALPPVPLAPTDCARYEFPGGTVSLHYPSINAQTEFAPVAGTTTVINATATTKYPQSSMSGRVTGGMNGSDIHLEVQRQGTSREYSPLILDGKIGADNRAHGTYTYDQGSGNWDSIEAMKCVPAPPAPAPAPAPAEPKPVAVEQPAPAPQEAPAPAPQEVQAPAPEQNQLCIPNPFGLDFPGAC